MALLPDNLLTEAERKSLSGLWFTAARPVEGLHAGRHRSPLKGHSTEFHDYRAYTPGDAMRSVDWKLYGRTDRLYVRRFGHDAELAVHLMLDSSASMDFDGAHLGGEKAGRADKWLAACKLAAAVAHLVIAQQDRFSLTLLGESASVALPLGGGWKHWQALCDVLASVTPAGMSRVARGQAEVPRPRGMVVLISDLMDDSAGWLDMIGRWVHQRNDAAVFQMLHPDEMNLPATGSWKAIDSETGRTVMTAGVSRAAYAGRLREHIERMQTALAGHGVDHQVIASDQSVIAALNRYISARTAATPYASKPVAEKKNVRVL